MKNSLQPTWQTDDGAIQLYIGDCMEVLPSLGKVDAVVTDPPYGINIASQPTKYQRAAKAKKRDWDSSTVDLDAVLSLGKVQVVWGGNYYSLPPSRCWLVWHKPDGPQSFSRVELAWTNIDKLAGYFRWTIAATNHERVGHPTQKPAALMCWYLEWVNAGKIVLDPFMGSGTTGVACIRTGRKFIGIEEDPEYFEIAKQRIIDELGRTKLIDAAIPKQAEMFAEVAQ